MGKLVMGYWDCKYCGSKKIKGTESSCPNCAHVKDKDVIPYMSGKVEYLSKEEAATKGKGADWQCEYCGAMNSVLTNVCQSCGANMEKDTKDYFDLHGGSTQTIKYVRKEGEDAASKLDTFYEDTNVEKIGPKKDSMWECVYCGTMNEKDVSVCINCGGTKEESANMKKTDTSDTFSDSYDNSKTSYENSSYKEVKTSTFTDKMKNFFKNYWKRLAIGGGAAIGLFLLIFGLIALLTPKERTIEISSVNWEYTVNIESYETYHESDWTVPPGGRITRVHEEIYDYEDVIDHYETKTRTYYEQVEDGYDVSYTYSDNGDGTFTEHEEKIPKYKTVERTEEYEEAVWKKVPIYKDKYDYDIERWKYKRCTTAKGSDKDPYFEEPILADNERESGRNKKYTFTGYIVEDEKTDTFKIDEDRWKKFHADQTITVKMRLGEIVEYLE